MEIRGLAIRGGGSSGSSSGGGSPGFLSQLRAIKETPFKCEKERQLAVLELRSLLSGIETPWETAFRYAWTFPTCMAALKVLIELDLFGKWEISGSQPKTAEELHQLVSCDYTLFRRLLTHLAANDLLEKTKTGAYMTTKFTAALVDPLVAATVDLYLDVNGPGAINLPKFIAKHGYQNPTDAENNNFKDMTGNSFWEHLKQNPQVEKTFASCMTAYANNRPSLIDIYPSGCLLKNWSLDTVLLVDVGGGAGHDVAAFRRHHADGRLILQERREVLQVIDNLDDSIEKMEYDFFTPQPVEGAAAYYLHFILHDWPDTDAKRILAAQKSAMTVNYSKLLIHEAVLDPKNPNSSQTTADLTMMSMVSASERTLEQWKTLLSDVGFVINSVHTMPLAGESLIEAEPI